MVNNQQNLPPIPFFVCEDDSFSTSFSGGHSAGGVMGWLYYFIINNAIFLCFFWKLFSYFQNPPGEGRRRLVSPQCALRSTTGPPQRSSRRSSRPAARSAGAPSSATRSPASRSGAHLPTPPAHFFHRSNTFNFFPKHHFFYRSALYLSFFIFLTKNGVVPQRNFLSIQPMGV